MVTLYVLIFGLVAIVPEYDDAGKPTNAVTALILNADGVTTRWGDHLPPHEAKLIYRDAPDGEITLSGKTFENLEISLGGDLGAEPMEVEDQHRILKIPQLYREGTHWSPSAFKVRAKCLRGIPNDCLDANDAWLVRGWIRLAGGWTVQPVEIDENRRVRLDVKDRSVFGFISLNEHRPKLASHVTQLAGGLLFKVEVPANGYTIQRNGTNMSVNPSDDCTEFGQPTGYCVRIEVQNLPARHAGSEIDCSEPGPDRIDTHLDRSFELLEDVPAWRFLPFLFELNEEDCDELYPGGAGGDPPRVKCPTLWLENYS